MIKKLKSRAGLTLTELVITLFMLTMFSAACLLGMTTAFSVRRDTIKASDANILASTVAQAISGEIRTRSDVGLKAVDDKLYYRINETEHWLELESGQIKVKTVNSSRDLLGSAAYGQSSDSRSESRLSIKELKFESVGTAIKVTVIICDESGHELSNAEFTVAPLNPKA